MIRLAFAAAALIAGQGAGAREPMGLHSALQQLTRDGKFSGAIVVRNANGVAFAHGFGLADPFTGRVFTPDTPIDSASLAKPVTAAAVLLLAHGGKLDLDAPVRRYIAEYPHAQTTVRHLLAHSAGLPGESVLDPLAGKTNEALVREISSRRLAPIFSPGTGFSYCNLCYSTLALLIERVSGVTYQQFVQNRVALPPGVTIRPLRLAGWPDRAIGYRRTADGKIERADSYEGEAFYGAANLSISAAQLASWGAEWWKPRLAGIRDMATTRAKIGGKPSGLIWGNWYCAAGRRRCHYLGHHEGFHHMLYWDRDRRISIAMVSNNTLAPNLQQRLQRALVGFAEGRSASARRELRSEIPPIDAAAGLYRLPIGETVSMRVEGRQMAIVREGLSYPAYLFGSGIRYVPGLDLYLFADIGGCLRMLRLYEDTRACPISRDAPRRTGREMAALGSRG